MAVNIGNFRPIHAYFFLRKETMIVQQICSSKASLACSVFKNLESTGNSLKYFFTTSFVPVFQVSWREW